VSFSRGETSKIIKVPVFGDTKPEEEETFFLNLAHASNAEILDVQGQGFILNDDAQISVVAPPEETTTTTTTLDRSTTTASVGQATRIVGMAPTPGADGYWVASANGGISALGAARYNASLKGSALPAHRRHGGDSQGTGVLDGRFRWRRLRLR
jgi:large repetitive protein